ncbi:MAG: hypothetical protein OXB84_00595 [Halobacteriovoraceae bacterium]|nr:hypothetical protein [Halobacteriovoraceae bacterium]
MVKLTHLYNKIFKLYDKIFKLYDKIPKEQFKYHVMILCFLGDLLIVRYIYRRFTDAPFLKQILQQSGKINTQYMPPDYFQHILYLVHNTLVCMLGAMMILHMIVYLIYYKKNPKSVIYYLKTLTWLGAIGSFYFAIASPNFPPANWLFYIQGVLYLHGALGLQKFS